MKKTYLLAAFAAFALTANAQFDDGFEAYTDGDIDAQSALWRTWSDSPGNAEDSDVISSNASDGTKSLALVEGNDMLLDFGGQTSGTYTWQYKLYLNPGSTGFFGLMSEQGATNTFGLQFRINDATLGQSTFTNPDNAAVGTPLDISEGEWHTITWIMDIGADTAIVNLNDTEIYNGELFLAGTLAWCDLWANDASTDLVIDEVRFVEGTLSSEDFNADVFSVYPNPVVDNLNIKSAKAVNAITIYDILGKVVLTTTPNIASPSIDMSKLSSGAYLVQITIDGTSETIKVIK